MPDRECQRGVYEFYRGCLLVSEKLVKKEWNVPHEKKEVLSEKYNIEMTAEPNSSRGSIKHI